jgi:hypothetical protein
LGISRYAIKLGLISALPPPIIGRWFALVARGQPLQRDIGQVAPVNYEMAIVVPVHYEIGVTLALAYSLVCLALGRAKSAQSIFQRFGHERVAWLVMFPAMGFGWFGAEGPPGTRLFLSRLANHGFYGLGLWLGAA